MRREGVTSRSPRSKELHENRESLPSQSDDESSDKSRKYKGIQVAFQKQLQLRPFQSLAIAFIVLFLCYRGLVKSKKQREGLHKFPVVAMIQDDGTVVASPLVLTADGNHVVRQHGNTRKRENRYWINHHKSDSDDSYHNERPLWPKKNCVAEEWMTSDACNCNTFHEISLDEFDGVDHNTNKRYPKFRYIKDGGFRVAWMTAEYNGTRRVLKTLRYIEKRFFDLDNLERHRRDAVAIEQLTASPFIADIYGHCAQSALVDYSDEASLYYIFDDDNYYPGKEELFEIAHDVIASVADTHHFNDNNRATIAHMDIKPNQWIYLDGGYKLNDFNLAKFLTWNTDKQKYCGHTSGYSSGRWQAPEQYHGDAPLSEKADVYSLGNVLYFLLTTDKPFHDMDGEDAFKYIAKGGKLTIDDPAILNSTHPFHVVVRQAMEMCLEHDPAKRPDARKVRDFIHPKLVQFQNEWKEKESAKKDYS